jgi:glycine/D-amino acid oxidase-like deaminating enzyme
MPRVLIVGGGILGTAHALEAVRRGFDVEQFEAEAEPRASTARSPGALHFSWAAGPLDLELSRRSARAWGELAGTDHGGFLRSTGSDVVAVTEHEFDVLQHLLARPDAADRRWELLEPSQVRRSNPAVRGAILGSLHSDLDVVVEPRAALDRLRSHLAGLDAFRFRGGREVRDFGADSITDATGRVHRGDLVVLCPGIRSDLATSALRQPSVLRPVRLQVAQTEPLAAVLAAPVSDVAAPLRHGLGGDVEPLPPQTDPLVGEVELRLTCVQRPGGALTVGEARTMEEPFDFDVAERPTKLLLGRLEEVLGCPVPPVARQWTGTVRECVDGRLWFREVLDDTVALVTGADQRGITLAPVIAEETFDWLMFGRDSGATHPGANRA